MLASCRTVAVRGDASCASQRVESKPDKPKFSGKSRRPDRMAERVPRHAPAEEARVRRIAAFREGDAPPPGRRSRRARRAPAGDKPAFKGGYKKPFKKPFDKPFKKPFKKAGPYKARKD